MTIPEVKKMSLEERLQAMEILWDSLTNEEYEIESPGWHKGILKEREKKIRDGKAEFISLEKLRSKPDES